MIARLMSAAAFVAMFVAMPVDGRAKAVFMADDLVIHTSFDGNFDNLASGAASVGILGVAVPNGGGGDTLARFIFGQPGSGQALWFPDAGHSDLAYHDAAFADIAGSTGITFSMWIVHGQMPRGAPAWLFNADSSQGNFGLRVNGNSDEFRACSPGGFFGGGIAVQEHWRHIAYTIVPEGDKFRAKFYLDGKLNAISPNLFDKIEGVKNAYIGRASYGGEWRLNKTLIDDFRLYNVAMTEGEIARLATEGGRAGTAASTRPASTLKSIAPKLNDEKELGDRRKQPFIVYTRDYTTPCFADYVPTAKETEDSLRVEMAANEYEPVQIGIYVPSGTEAVSDLHIEVDIDIPNKSGYLYYHASGQRWRPVDGGRWYADYPGGRRAMPRYLVPGSRVKRIEPGQSAGIWITFHTDDRVGAGVHRGEVVITPRGGKAQRRPLEVVVRPFALPRPKALFGLYYRPDRIPRYWTRGYQEKYAHHMKAHGMNSGQIASFFPSFGSEAYQLEGRVPPPPTANSWIEPWLSLLDPQEYADGKVDPGRLVEAQIEMFQDAGLIYPDIPVFGVQENPLCENKAIVADTFRRMSIERGWPEILFQTRDEPPAWTSEGDGLPPPMVNAMLEWKRIKNCRTFTALSMAPAIAWGHLHDIWIVMGGEITPEMMREAKRQGGQVFTYLERIRLTNVLINRYYSGLYTWGLGLDGNTPYCYCMYPAPPEAGQGATDGVWLSDQERPSHEMIHSYIVPGPDGPIPGVGFEGRREGVDDYRYLQLLEARVVAAGPTSVVAKEASRWLADLRRRIEKAAIRGLFGTGYQYLWELDWVDPQPDIDPLEYHEIRETAARYISQLPAAVGESNAPPSTVPRQFPSSGWEGEPFHGRSLDQCLRALEKGSVADRRGAANAILFKDLDALDPGRLTDCIETLARLLEQPEVRMPAIRALRVFGPKAAPALEALKRQLDAEDPYVRCGALLAMESMGTVAIDGFIKGLEDPFGMNSVMAAECLARIGPDAARAIPALKRAMASAMIRGQKQDLQRVIDSISRAAP